MWSLCYVSSRKRPSARQGPVNKPTKTTLTMSMGNCQDLIYAKKKICIIRKAYRLRQAGDTFARMSFEMRRQQEWKARAKYEYAGIGIIIVVVSIAVAFRSRI